MFKLSFGGIAIGILIGGVIAFLFFSTYLQKPRKKEHVSLWRNIFIALTLCISVYMGLFMGCYYIEGNYTSKECSYWGCHTIPTTVKVRAGLSTEYYCTEHLDKAQKHYATYSGSGSSDSSYSRCTICRDKATHTYQDSGYCDEHYEDAVKWSIDNVLNED